MTGVLVLVLTLVVAGGAGLAMRARNGRMRPAAGPVVEVADIDLGTLGVEPGDRATLLQFSSAFCAPCRATRAVLGEIAGAVPGVRHVEVDVAGSGAAMDLVRRLDIRRTPTTLVLDARAREVRRASGVPRRDQVLAAVGEAVDDPPAAAPDAPTTGAQR